MEPLDRSTTWPYDERGEPTEFYYQRYGSPTVSAAEASGKKIHIRKTGCMGPCSSGPLVRVADSVPASLVPQ